MKANSLFRWILTWVLVATLLPSFLGIQPVAAAPELPPDTPVERFAPSSQEPVRMWVVLEDRPVVEMMNAGHLESKADQERYQDKLAARQQAVVREAQTMGAPILAQLYYLVNAVAVEVTPGQAEKLRSLPNVAAVYPVQDGTVDLGNSVPWIGAVAAQETGFDGTGVTIAIIDSGVDYTHAAFGGPGTVAAYTEATSNGNNTVISDTFGTGMTFPTAKVIGGWDFLGSQWCLTNTVVLPDPDPIDDGPQGSHGTHVAGIAAGMLVTDTTGTLVHQGVAPGASIRAYKVCSSLTSSCNGVAMVQAMEQAAVTDTVDVINMSIGNSYGGAYEDYVTTVAAQNAAGMGVLVSVSAGNSEDKPYISGAPSAARGVLSTANSFANNQFAPMLRVSEPVSVAKDYEGAYFSWAPLITAPITAPVVFVGTGCIGDPSIPDLTGKIALVRRGVCSFTNKVAAVQLKGAVAAIIANNSMNGLPYAGAFDNTVTVTIQIPAVAMGTIDGDILSNAAGVIGTFSPDVMMDLADAISGSSSRGPRIWDNAIKPDITAPGSNILAAGMGTGNQAVAKSGTSMAAPHMAGVLALMHQKYPTWTRQDIYNALLNTAKNETTLQGRSGMRAPVALQGAGRVQVMRALNAQTLAWSLDSIDDGKGLLSFGYRAVAGSLSLTKTVVVRNLSAATRTYTPTFENIYADDINKGITVRIVPATPFTVAAGMTRTIQVNIQVDPTGLKTWPLDGGYNGGNGFAMTDVEFDGFVKLQSDLADASVSLPLYLLPHKSAQAQAPSLVPYTDPEQPATLSLNNGAAFTGTAQLFAWAGSDPAGDACLDDVCRGNLDLVEVGVRRIGPVFEFAIVTRDPEAHPYTSEFDIYIDTNKDGTADYAIYNVDSNTSSPTGQNIGRVCQLGGSCTSTGYYTNVDLNSRVRTLSVRPSSLGITQTAQHSFNFYVEAYDSYYLDETYDVAPDGETWYTFDANALKYAPEAWTVSAPQGTTPVSVLIDSLGYPEQKGLLALYEDQAPAYEAQGISFSYLNLQLYLPVILRAAQ